MKPFINDKLPKTWLVESILVTLFCCMPFGIVALVNATKVEPLFFSKQYEAAHRHAHLARRWVLCGLVCFVIFVVLYVASLIWLTHSLSGNLESDYNCC